jgi:hypothetical protein
MRCPPLGDKCPNEVGWENVTIAKYAVTSNIAHRRLPGAHLELRRAMLCTGADPLQTRVGHWSRRFPCTNIFGNAILGRSYKAHWELLGRALCLLTASAIPRTGPVWVWGFCPGSRRPRARVPLVVWAWDLVVIRLLCCGLPAPARRQFFALRFVTVCH